MQEKFFKQKKMYGRKGVRKKLEFKENAIEWITGQHYAVVTFTNKRHINRIKSIYEDHKDEFKYFFENEDGSICAKIPTRWIKINSGRKGGRIMTEEQKEAARVRLAEARTKMQKKIK